MTEPSADLWRPDQVQRHSLTPRMSKLYLLISLNTWAEFDVSYMVRTFHAPILICALGPSRLHLAALTSPLRLSLELVILLLATRLKSLPGLVDGLLVIVVAVSVTCSFLQGGVVGPTLNPQPGGPGDHSSSGPYLSTCSAWVTLPGVQKLPPT